MSLTTESAGLFRSDSAAFSPCGLYRFKLSRDLGDEQRKCCFIMLNPSKATATTNNPTVRRNMGFAHSWGYGWLDVGNLFPLRSTDPKLLWQEHEPTDIRLHNVVTVVEMAKQAQLVIVAWGSQNHRFFRERRDWLVERLRAAGVQLHCLGTTSDGNPHHPLYVRGDAQPAPWKLP